MNPKVSIIVTAYDPKAKPYLDLCVRSIDELHYDNLEKIIVGRVGYFPEYLGWKTVCPEKPEFFPPVGLNFGINEASGDYFFVLNDDTIVTNKCLVELMKWQLASSELGLLMPVSNDQQGLYHFPRLKIDQNENWVNFAHQMTSPYPDGLIFHKTLCIYAFLLSRSAWDKIGPFDETLINMDDIDYSWRSENAGLKNAIATNALVWHWGGRSTATGWNNEIRQKGLEIFNKKWHS